MILTEHESHAGNDSIRSKTAFHWTKVSEEVRPRSPEIYKMLYDNFETILFIYVFCKENINIVDQLNINLRLHSKQKSENEELLEWPRALGRIYKRR